MDETTGEVRSDAVAAQLERLCGSATFKNSSRLCRFLRYTVEVALRGEGETLKEYVIGTEVYDRRPPYHPSQDSIVRTEAKRLRNKLKEYYATEGLEDGVLIYYRNGSYQPVFRWSGKAEKESKTSPLPSSGFSDKALPGITIAVLPFRHEEDDPITAAIAAGITDDLIFCITSTEGCRVVAPQSVAALQSETQEIGLLSVMVNADQIITGSVRKTADRVRVSVTGVHPSGLETWSERFDLTTAGSDVLVLEEQIASAIVARIAPQESVLRRMQERVPSVCLAEFPEMISAEELLDKGTSSSIRGALIRFNNLAARLSTSARIQCGIVQCHYALALLGENAPPAYVRQAKEAAERALQLDPEMAEAHAAMGCSLALEHRWHGAEQAFHSALMRRASPAIRHVYADLLMSLGRFEEAEIQLQEARRVDPFSCRQRVCTARLRYLTWRSSDPSPALSEERHYGRTPKQVLLFKAELLLQMGRRSEAMTLADDLLRDADEASGVVTDIVAILALAGEMDRAQTLANRFQLLSQSAPVSRIYQARLCGALREEEACRSLLEAAVAQAEPQLCWLQADPKFADLRKTSFYGPTVGKLKLPFGT